MKINWPTKKLGKVCYFEGGKQPPKIHFIDQPKNGYIRLIQIRDFGSDEKAVYIPKELAKNWVDKDDILISRYGGFRNYKSFFNILTGKSGAFNVALIKVIPDESLVNKKFIYFQLQLPRYKNILIKKSDRAVQSGFRRKDLENLEVVIPPLSIQQKIVECLDAIRKVQELNEKQISLTDELFQSLLHQELKPHKKWQIKKFFQIFRRVKDLILPKEYPDKKFNFVGLENIESNTGYIVNFKPTKGSVIKSTKIKFLKSDTLFGKLRPYLNKIWFAEFDGICSTDIWVLRPNTSGVLPELLPIILGRPVVIEKCSVTMTGSSLPRANRNIFDNIKIYLPPLKTQLQIVEKLSAVQEYKRKLLKQKQLLQELFEATLDKAMKGEIVE